MDQHQATPTLQLILAPTDHWASRMICRFIQRRAIRFRHQAEAGEAATKSGGENCRLFLLQVWMASGRSTQTCLLQVQPWHWSRRLQGAQLGQQGRVPDPRRLWLPRQASLTRWNPTQQVNLVSAATFGQLLSTVRLAFQIGFLAHHQPTLSVARPFVPFPGRFRRASSLAGSTCQPVGPISQRSSHLHAA